MSVSVGVKQTSVYFPYDFFRLGLNGSAKDSAAHFGSFSICTRGVQNVRGPTKKENKAMNCGSEMLPHLPFFMDLAPSGSNLLPNMRKTFDSYVFAKNEEMIGSVPNGHAGMLEIFFFKACLRAKVKSYDKCGNMNGDYIDQQTVFVSKSSSYLCSFMVGPRTF